MYNWKGRDALKNIKPYSPGKGIDEVKAELGLEEVYKMASNENPLGPAKTALDAISNALQDVHIYPDGSSGKLKKAIGEKYGVNVDEIIVGNGSDEIIKLIAESFLNEDSNLIMGDPSFSEYDYAGNLMGAEVIKVPLIDQAFDLEGILEAITINTKIIALCNPNNPTGTVIDKENLLSFIDRVPNNIIVILDEAYGEYAGVDFYSGINLIKARKGNILVLRTFSKIFGLAALRVGYGVANKNLIEWILRAKEPFNVNYLAQVGAEAAINDNKHIEDSLELNERGKKYLSEQFVKRGFLVTPSGANFLWVDTRLDSQLLFQELLKKGYVIRPGYVFGADTFIRVTIDKAEVNLGFIMALDEIIKEI